MVDVAAIKKSADLMALVSENVTLRRTASTRGGEYHGPCPFCGGKDRFWVQPYYDPPRWKCRGCSKGGDAIKFVQERDGLSFLDACRELERRFGLQPTATVPYVSRSVTEEPTTQWRHRATLIATECATALWCGGMLSENALAYLRSRGLHDETIVSFGLGYNAPNRRRTFEDGTENWGEYRHGLWVSAGITIPIFAVDGNIWGINVRRPKGEPKYKGISGSKLGVLMGHLGSKSVLLLSEGPFDMMLAHQECGDLIDVATLGSADVGLNGRWLPYVLRYRHVLVAYDNDVAGDEGADRILRSLARARRVRVPLAKSEGKDITDFWGRGGNLRTWIESLL